MAEFNIESLAGMSPTELARLVKRTPHATLTQAMRGEHRRQILDSIFTSMPTIFRPDRAGSTSAVIHWQITGRPDGEIDRYQIAIGNGTCTSTPLPDPSGATLEPRLTITLGGVELLQLIAGTTNPAMMFMMGKIKAKGDISLAASFPNLFDMPRV
jgi:putative sterol carrier protein